MKKRYLIGGGVAALIVVSSVAGRRQGSRRRRHDGEGHDRQRHGHQEGHREDRQDVCEDARHVGRQGAGQEGDRCGCGAGQGGGPQPKPEPEPHYTVSQEQAIGSAQDYVSEDVGFSREGLIGQLSSQYGEGFPKADAVFAVDHVKVNWNQQAVFSAKSYLDTEHFSRAGLISQLESQYGEQFTHAQAVYGVNHTGL